MHLECTLCDSKDTYYRRKTNIDSFDAYSYMLLFWKSAQNIIHVDFDIYSTMEDALA
jgi:hypothetical protein